MKPSQHWNQCTLPRRKGQEGSGWGAREEIVGRKQRGWVRGQRPRVWIRAVESVRRI